MARPRTSWANPSTRSATPPRHRGQGAFVAEYVTPGRLISDSPPPTRSRCGSACCPTPGSAAGARRLADLVRRCGYHIGTGFVGTPIVTDALCDAGARDDAYPLLLQRNLPSWLYPVTMGATTIWERWDSMLPDGSLNPGEMTSFNHYALGASPTGCTVARARLATRATPGEPLVKPLVHPGRSAATTPPTHTARPRGPATTTTTPSPPAAQHKTQGEEPSGRPGGGPPPPHHKLGRGGGRGTAQLLLT